MTIDNAYLDRLEEYGPIARTLSMCLRPTFCAEGDNNTLIWGDWSSIEARKLPWLANSPGADAVLDVFRAVDSDPNAADIYMIEAGNIHGVDPYDINARIKEGDKEAKGWRQEGKVAVLALGFGGSVGALQAMAAGYGLYFDDETAQRIVDVWRKANGWAVDFWAELKEAFFSAFQNPGHVYEAGRLAYVYDPSYHGGTVFCYMPDGRVLSYPNLRYREVEREDKKTGKTYMQKVLAYRKGYKWGSIWHGILAENPTQGSAASVLRTKLRHMDAAFRAPKIEFFGSDDMPDIEAVANDGFADFLRDTKAAMPVPIIVRGHTHDEIITEAHQDDAEEGGAYLKKVMDEPLPWTEGLPLVSEITSHWTYTKSLD